MLVRLVEVYTSWPKHPHQKKKNAIYEYNFNIYSKGVRQVIYLFNVEEMVLMRSQDENRYRENKIK